MNFIIIAKVMVFSDSSYAPQQKDIVKRKNKTIMKMVRN